MTLSPIGELRLILTSYVDNVLKKKETHNVVLQL